MRRRAGEIVLQRGAVIRPAEIGLLAAMGLTAVAAVPRPAVAILSTGDELAWPGEPLSPGMIYNSNAFALSAQVAAVGARPILLGVARDDVEAVRRKAEEGLEADLLVVSGGVSVGDRDLVREALEGMGMETRFWRVRMRPGKALLFGLIRGRPVVGLPGNPAASMLSFDYVVAPAVRRMRGLDPEGGPSATALLDEAIPARPGRTSLVRVILRDEDGVRRARPCRNQGAGIMRSLAAADGYVALPAGAAAAVGSEVRVRLLGAAASA